MTDHAHPGAGAVSGTQARDWVREETVSPTLWVGWIWFAGTIMIMVGVFNVMYGLVALLEDTFYTVGANGLLVFDLTGWGWVHLIMGVLAVLAGSALFTGATWARVVAVLLAAVNAFAQLAFLSAYPVWATIVIALDVLIIWAVIVHGKELRTNEWA